MDNGAGLLAVDLLVYPSLRSSSSSSALCSAHGTTVCFCCHIAMIYMAAGSSHSAFSTTKNRAILMTHNKMGR